MTVSETERYKAIQLRQSAAKQRPSSIIAIGDEQDGKNDHEVSGGRVRPPTRGESQMRGGGLCLIADEEGKTE
jgi:hypothetical protein